MRSNEVKWGQWLFGLFHERLNRYMLQFDPKSPNLVTSVMFVIGVIKLWYTRQYPLTSSLEDSSCLTRSSRSCAGKCRVFIPSSVVPTRCRAICSRRSCNQTWPIRKKLAMTQVCWLLLQSNCPTEFYGTIINTSCAGNRAFLQTRVPSQYMYKDVMLPA